MTQNEVIVTIFHYKDDKGWEHDKRIEGDIIHHNVYRILKKSGMYNVPLINTEAPQIPSPLEYYEFDFIKQSFEHFSLHYYIKHFYYEMRCR